MAERKFIYTASEVGAMLREIKLHYDPLGNLSQSTNAHGIYYKPFGRENIAGLDEGRNAVYEVTVVGKSSPKKPKTGTPQ